MKIRHLTSLGAALFLAAATAPAATYSLVHSFGSLSNVTGFEPQAALVQDASGTLYGTTTTSEGAGTGTVFKVQPDGSGFQVLRSFSTPVNFTNAEGANPYAGLVLSGTTLYGTTYNGGAGGSGTIFTLQTDGGSFSVLTNFQVTRNLTNSTGSHPYGALVLSGSVLYGTTQGGGLQQNGTVFKVNTNGTGLTVLKTFSATPAGVNGDGAVPDGTLVISNNILYGTTTSGGPQGDGVIFSLDAGTLSYSLLHAFTGGTDGAFPHGGVTLYNGLLFGTATGGGANGWGTVYMLGTTGSGFNPIYSFTGDDDGAIPDGGVIIAGNTLYGTTYTGGAGGFGTVYSVNTNSSGITNGSGFNTLFAFDGSASGGNSVAGLTLFGSTLYGSTAGATGQEDTAGGNGTLFAVNTNGVGATNIFTFNFTDGVEPHGNLIASGNALYGTTFEGGAGGNGTVFRVNADGSGYAILKSFSAFGFDLDAFVSTNGDGANPQSGLVLADGALYGTAFYGGSNGFGTIYSVNTNGSGFTTLYNFTGGNDGDGPQGSLVYAGGVLYGTAVYGGTNNNGVIFSINSNGTGFTVLKTFTATTSGTNGDGANPFAGLTLSGSALYGAALNGGVGGFGAVFSIGLSGAGFVNLHNFNGSDGANPYGSLLVNAASIYGTTYYGGTVNNGTVFKVSTTGGGFASLKSFSGLGQNPATGLSTNSDGANPYGGLALLGTNLYGSTVNGGAGYGTAFAMDIFGTPGSFTNLYVFGFGDGANPYSSLLLSGNALYGSALNGGAVGDGLVFGLTLFPASIPLNIQCAGANVILTWTNAAFTLQSAPTVSGTYTNVPGAMSPYTNSVSATQQFFRLQLGQ